MGGLQEGLLSHIRGSVLAYAEPPGDDGLVMGSAQVWVEGALEEAETPTDCGSTLHSVCGNSAAGLEWSDLAVFDYLIGNGDRKGNVMRWRKGPATMAAALGLGMSAEKGEGASTGSSWHGMELLWVDNDGGDVGLGDSESNSVAVVKHVHEMSGW